MTFSLLELSRYAGQPIGLLRLARGSLVERYSNGDRPITIGAETFQPLAISRGPIQDSAQRRKNTLTLTLPIDAPCTAWWRPYPPATPVVATWLALHYGDDEADRKSVV